MKKYSDYTLIKIEDGLKVELSPEAFEALAHNYQIISKYDLGIGETDDGFSVYFKLKRRD